MRKILCTVLRWPETITEGEVIHLTLEKSGVIFEVDNVFVAHERQGRDMKEFAFEATDPDPTYGNKTLNLASRVITCWLPNTKSQEGTAHLWIDS